MKKHSSSITARATLSALLLASSVVLVVVAVNSNVLMNGVSGTLQAQAAPTAIPPAPPDPGPKIGYENFAAPGVLVPVKTTEAGQQPDSVEYMGRNAGEPSVGSNWITGVENFQSGLQTLFVTFNDSCPVSGQSAAWVNRAAPTAVAIDSDPIGFTDRGFMAVTGPASRVFASQLTLLSPNTVKISYTDDDGVTWVPTQTGGLASGVDHQTIGGGIYHSPIPPRPPGTVYPNAIYYCSQDIATAFCSRSDNGGLNYGPSVPLYTLIECGGLHGHVKVSPADGTAYVPNPDCGTQALVVSKDNGNTWTVSPVPVDVPGGSGVGSDPAVGIDSAGKVYFLGVANGGLAVVATSVDQGASWQNIFDVSSEFGLKQIAFPAAVAGSAGRAAVAFYGSTGAGDSNAASFQGVWHLYVSHTFDGGLHWTTTDVTPNAPMQRSGLLRGGGANITRNLLDFFDITIDRDGRVLVGYVDGCEGGNCKQAISTATGNAYSVTATIARQSSGRRQLSTKDPASTTSKPGMPSVSQVRIGPVVHLAWSEADTGNSPITGYQIWRGTASNAETLLTTVPGTQTGGAFDDLTATDTTKTYYYKVMAVNALGASCGNNEVAAPYLGNGCTGIILHKNDPTHPEANAGTETPPELLIDYIAIGEPANSPGNFMFKMKVNDLSGGPPPNSRWRITWNSPDAETYSPAGEAQQFYVGMTTGPSGPPTFEYGTLADAGVPAVFVITETKRGEALPASNFTDDGTITIFAPKIAFGPQVPDPTAPAVGSLLGAVSGRTLTGDAPGSPESKLERSNAFVDHTFVKAQTDNSFPAATYTVAGNIPCPAVSNTPPTAVLMASPTSGNKPLKVTFDGTGSTDPDFSDTITNYTFHFGDGTPDVSGGAPIVEHTYNSAGTFTATLVVTDSRGATSQNTAQKVITVTQPTPTPTPTPAPTATPSATPTPTPGPSPTATPGGSPTPTPTATPVSSPTPTPSGSPTPTPTATPVSSPTPTPSGSPTPTPTATPVSSPTPTPSGSPTPTPTATPVSSPTPTPSGSPTATPTATPVASPTASPTATPTASPTPTATATPTATPTPTPAPTPVNVQLLNISGRVDAKTGDKIGIGGFIITGSGTKRIMARAIGPSLKAANGTALQGRLQDPYLELHDSNGSPPLINDDWRTAQGAEIQQTGLAPSDDKESAIVKRLPAGNYTAIIRGADNSPGIGVVELYDLSSTEPGELGNLSVRADVGTDDNVLIDGVILRGGEAKRILFRALGPSVKENGTTVPGALQDPTLDVYDGNGTLLRSNNDWHDAPNANEIQKTGLAPPDDHESAVLLNLESGNYTAIVRGADRTTGIALAEAYKLSN